MSRQSAASLSVASVGIPQRISPPEELTDFQKEVWVRVVATKPVDWFGDDSAPVLVEYVRAVDASDRLETMVRDALSAGGPDANPNFFKLMKARDTEAKRAADLATKLRLTQQSRYTPQAAATANKKGASSNKPWQQEQKAA